MTVQRSACYQDLADRHQLTHSETMRCYSRKWSKVNAILPVLFSLVVLVGGAVGFASMSSAFVAIKGTLFNAGYGLMFSPLPVVLGGLALKHRVLHKQSTEQELIAFEEKIKDIKNPQKKNEFKHD